MVYLCVSREKHVLFILCELKCLGSTLPACTGPGLGVFLVNQLIAVL